MNRIIFTSDQLPAHLGDRARFAHWHEQFEALTCCVDYARFEDRAFRARFQFAQFAGVQVTLFDGTLKRFARSASAIARGPDDDFCLLLNRGTAGLRLSQFGRDTAAGVGGAFLGTNGAAAEMVVEAPGEWATVTVARDRLLQLVPRADDLMARPLDPGRPALRHLERYLESVLDQDDTGNEPALEHHIGTTLLDLLALTLGAGRDTVQVARMRGLRAARVRDILAVLKADFADPAVSATSLAAKLQLSPAYIQRLLYETGASLTQRVLELRLQKARAMLAGASHRGARISDIAFACGFSEASYFNRCFRRRFGASPTQFRGRDYRSTRT